MATSSITKKVVITKRSEARRFIKALEDAKNDVKAGKAKKTSKDIKGKDVVDFFGT